MYVEKTTIHKNRNLDKQGEFIMSERIKSWYFKVQQYGRTEFISLLENHPCV